MTDAYLIKLIKRYPVLYDKSLAEYRDLTIRNNAWVQISEELNTPDEELKNRWSRLRNCFTNALKRRRKKSDQAGTNMAPWKYEQQMEFLLPHVQARRKTDKLTYLSDNESTKDSVLQMSEAFVLSSPCPNSSPARRASTSSAARSSTPVLIPTRLNKNGNDENNLLSKIIDVMRSSQKRAATDMDENDYFFLSMSKQLKKLPKIDQTEIKFQLHKLIHDAEMKMLSNSE